MNALVQLLNTVARFLSGHGIPHAVVGGITVALWGRPRATEDIDLLIDLPETEVPEFVAYLRDHDISFDEEQIRGAADGGSFALEDTWSIHWIDARTPRDAFDLEVIERARPIEVHGERFHVASPEDVVLAKLRIVQRLDEANQTGQDIPHADKRATHLMDARSIIKRQGDAFDLEHLETRIAALGLDPTWARLQAAV